MRKEEMEKERKFNEMAKIVEEYLKKYGHPHLTIIATQTGIEVVEGIKSKPFTLED